MNLMHSSESTKMPLAITKVFVYGTLKEGHSRQGVMDGCKSFGVGTVRGYLFHLGQFPALVLGDEAPLVYGELYEVDLAKLAVLDAIEGNPDFYQRLPIYVPAHGAAWVYTMPLDRARQHSSFVCPTGTWIGPETRKMGYFVYMNDNPDYKQPSLKPSTTYDHATQMWLIRQTAPRLYDKPREGGVIVEAPAKAIPPRAPVEASQAPLGMKIEYL